MSDHEKLQQHKRFPENQRSDLQCKAEETSDGLTLVEQQGWKEKRNRKFKTT